MIHSRNPRRGGLSMNQPIAKADLHVPENAVDKLILDFIMIRAIRMTLPPNRSYIDLANPFSLRSNFLQDQELLLL